MLRTSVGFLAAVLVATSTSSARAEEEEEEGEGGSRTSVALRLADVSLGGAVLNVFGAPSFSLGKEWDRFALRAGLGLRYLRTSQRRTVLGLDRGKDLRHAAGAALVET